MYFFKGYNEILKSRYVKNYYSLELQTWSAVRRLLEYYLLKTREKFYF